MFLTFHHKFQPDSKTDSNTLKYPTCCHNKSGSKNWGKREEFREVSALENTTRLIVASIFFKKKEKTLLPYVPINAHKLNIEKKIFFDREI